MLETIFVNEFPRLTKNETEDLFGHCPVCDALVTNPKVRVEQLPSSDRRVVHSVYDMYNGCCSTDCAKLLYDRETTEMKWALR